MYVKFGYIFGYNIKLLLRNIKNHYHFWECICIRKHLFQNILTQKIYMLLIRVYYMTKYKNVVQDIKFYKL